MSLELREVSLRLAGREVLSGISAAPFARGEFTVLAGPNGVGKSTLLRAIAQFLPYRGEVLFDGEPLSGMSPARRADLAGFMPQNLQSRSDLSVLEGLLVAMNAAGGTREGQGAQIRRAEALLAQFGIAALAGRGLARLSGGQRQTVGLAQALARDPTLLLLDEPTAALDLAMQYRILAELAAIARRDRVVIAVLHDLTQAARWADRLVVLHRGRVAADGPPEQILTPELLAEVYRVRARVERDGAGQLFVAVDGPA
ncbi:ABC transporter ATP-binding protein [Poseidonocella sedimentorum]|uniref:Iron complex transport system ATP-binding protein n=1 Tax=Poseidonocella sedimentorum TaxID=871652 RepID=A0A1I6E4R8_9RHOB|nr:ABC transporter ATP-binding protein [Poseidonocella sedimentorum]SFR12468.1 iron complex transport system ATP-binding protein [Poseidonocella sedimentorum]